MEEQRKSKNIGVHIAITVFTIINTYFIIDMYPILNQWLFIAMTFASLAFGLAMIILLLKGKSAFAKLGFMGIVAITLIAGVFYIFYKLDMLTLLEDVNALKEELSHFQSVKIGFILLQFAQVVFLPIPSTVTVALGTVLFSPIEAVIYSMIGIIAGSIVMFFFGRYAGRKAIEWALGKEDLDKYMKLMKGKDNSIITAMFILPGFPDDILCTVAGMTTMKTRYYIIMMTVARLLSVGVSVAIFSGNFIPFEGKYIALWILFGAIVVGLTIFYFKNTEKVKNAFLKVCEKFKKNNKDGK